LEEFFDRIGASRRPRVLKLRSRASEAKEAAEGAALIANGLVGGKYRPLVECLELERSSGDIFSNITMRGEVRRALERFRKLAL